jgi:hypothetical protein
VLGARGLHNRSPRAKLGVQVKQPRRLGLRGKSGHHRARWSRIDPGKPAGKCHRNKPPTPAVPRERLVGKGEMVR